MVAKHAVGLATDEPEILSIAAGIRRLLAVGETLPSERDLAEKLNVKRYRLRQALAQLRAAGELAPTRVGRKSSSLPRHGEELVRVTNPIEVIELRLILEPGLARLAAIRASPFEIARIARAATTPSNAEYGEADLAFHRAVASAGRNGLATEFYKLLRRVGTDTRVRLGGSDRACSKRLAQRDSEHRAIADAIAKRDPDTAEMTMRIHLAMVQKRIMDRFTAGVTAA